MPQMGVSVAEGTIIEWRKRPGDWVEADEPVCDVTTDKVDVEIPSPASGRLERILVEPGATRSRWARCWPRSTRRRSPARRTREEHLTWAVRDGRDAGRTARRIGPGSTRRWCGGSPTSTGSTSPGSPAPGSVGAYARRTSGLHRVRRAACLWRLRPSPSCTPSRPTGPSRAPRRPAPAGWSRSWSPGRREQMSPMRQAIARTWLRAAERRLTARRSSRSTCRG